MRCSGSMQGGSLLGSVFRQLSLLQVLGTEYRVLSTEFELVAHEVAFSVAEIVPALAAPYSGLRYSDCCDVLIFVLLQFCCGGKRAAPGGKRDGRWLRVFYAVPFVEPISKCTRPSEVPPERGSEAWKMLALPGGIGCSMAKFDDAFSQWRCQAGVGLTTRLAGMMAHKDSWCKILPPGKIGPEIPGPANHSYNLRRRPLEYEPPLPDNRRKGQGRPKKQRVA